MEIKREWQVVTYDDNIEQYGTNRYIGTHTEAVLFAEKLIDGKPQWSYQLTALPADTEAVLDEITAERRRQNAKWGEQNHIDGTGPAVVLVWVEKTDDARAADLAESAKGFIADAISDGDGVTWRDILLEEVFEALAEDDAARLRTELIQVAAVATQWVEAIDRRASAE